MLACLTSKGCSETANIYYDSKPQLQLIAKNLEFKVRHVVGDDLITYAAPIAFYGAGQTATIKLYGPFFIKSNYQFNELLFRKDF
jgi:hypothetical protein